MRHIVKDRCGYSDYQCIGLPTLKKTTLCADPVIYSDSTAVRVNDDNFYNVPYSILGAVKSTVYNSLQTMQNPSIMICIDELNAFKGTTGFLDTLKHIIKLQNFKSWGNELISYQLSDSAFPEYSKQEIPGILMPMSRPSDFSSIPAITLPVTIHSGSSSSVDGVARSIGYATAKVNAQSGCTNTCRIRAQFTDNPGVSVIMCQPDDQPKWAIYVNIAGCKAVVGTNEYVVEWQSQGQVSVIGQAAYQIAVILTYDVLRKEWRAKGYIETTDNLPAVTKFQHMIQLGTATCAKVTDTVTKEETGKFTYALSVTQPQCIPMLNDWVATQGLPSSSGVHVFTANQSDKKWMQCIQCE